MEPSDYEYAHAQALAAGEPDALAGLFASYYAQEVLGYQQDIADGEPAPENGVPAAALYWAWAYLGHYKRAFAKGHTHSWAHAYAQCWLMDDSEARAEEAGYEATRTASGDLALGHRNEAVYQEAYLARADRGAAYATAYATSVSEGETYTADRYAEAVAAQLQADKSPLYAHEYGSSISSNFDPLYAAIEAEVYERVLTGGMEEAFARMYSRRLAENLFNHADDTAEDIDFYTKEADAFIAQAQRNTAARTADANKPLAGSDTE